MEKVNKLILYNIKMSAVQEGLDIIHNSITKHVLDFLKTGEFKNKSSNAYMTAYQ